MFTEHLILKFLHSFNIYTLYNVIKMQKKAEIKLKKMLRQFPLSN